MGWKARSGPAWHRSVGNALLDKHEITQTHLDINDRLGPKSRYGGAADVLDVLDLVAHDSKQTRLFLLEESGPSRIVLDNDDLMSHACFSLGKDSSVLASPASDSGF